MTEAEVRREQQFFQIYNPYKRRCYQRENRKLTADPIVFLGDSITDYCRLKKWFPDFLPAVNRGIAGNTTADVLDRLELSVREAHPREVVVLIGVNDMMNEGRPPEDVLPNIELILRLIRSWFPAIPIVVQSAYPTWDGDPEKTGDKPVFVAGYLNQDILTLNQGIRALAEKLGCVYADIHSVLRLEDNTMNPLYCDDGVHPNEEGYRVITEALRPYLLHPTPQ